LSVEVHHILFTYVFPVCNTMYLMLATTTYALIFNKFKLTRNIPVEKRTRRRRQGVTESSKPSTTETQSLLQIYRNSRFHIPVLIITSFLLFKVTPDLITEVLGCTDSVLEDTTLHVCLMSYSASGMISAYVYLFTQPSVKNLMRKKLRQLRVEWTWRKEQRSRSSINGLPQWQKDIRMRNVHEDIVMKC
jgi:hypothetical protein